MSYVQSGHNTATQASRPLLIWLDQTWHMAQWLRGETTPVAQTEGTRHNCLRCVKNLEESSKLRRDKREKRVLHNIKEHSTIFVTYLWLSLKHCSLLLTRENSFSRSAKLFATIVRGLRRNINYLNDSLLLSFAESFSFLQTCLIHQTERENIYFLMWNHLVFKPKRQNWNNTLASSFSEL